MRWLSMIVMNVGYSARRFSAQSFDPMSETSETIDTTASKPPKIRCTTCGEEADQARIGGRPEAVETRRDDTGEAISFIDQQA